jgi:hypothetical protein
MNTAISAVARMPADHEMPEAGQQSGERALAREILESAQKELADVKRENEKLKALLLQKI